MNHYAMRVYERIIPEPNSGCWLWIGAQTKRGYGYCRYPVNGRNDVQNVHRVVYQLERGKIPDGLELDHLCRTPCCVNPDHLEPVTHATNMGRGMAGIVRGRQLVGNTIWKLRKRHGRKPKTKAR